MCTTEEPASRPVLDSSTEEDLILLVGPSGAGNRVTIAILEDLFEYAAITKVAPENLWSIVQGARDGFRKKRVAIQVSMPEDDGSSVEEFGKHFIRSFGQALAKLRATGNRFRILFLYCAQDELALRQSYGYHPFHRRCGSIRAAIFKECEIIVELFCRTAAASPDNVLFLDTSGVKPEMLRSLITKIDRRLNRSQVQTTLSKTFITRGWNKMYSTQRLIKKVKKKIFKGPCSTDALNILLLGENGTGKELIARYLHGEPTGLNIVNCAAIPETLIESELFGSVKGSFQVRLTEQGS